MRAVTVCALFATLAFASTASAATHHVTWTKAHWSSWARVNSAHFVHAFDSTGATGMYEVTGCVLTASFGITSTTPEVFEALVTTFVSGDTTPNGRLDNDIKKMSTSFNAYEQALSVDATNTVPYGALGYGDGSCASLAAAYGLVQTSSAQYVAEFQKVTKTALVF